MAQQRCDDDWGGGSIPSHDVAADRQTPATVLFTGLPGSGKTSLARAVERRLFDAGHAVTVLDGHLKDHEYLAGDYSIADIANWAWVRTYRWSGVSLDGLPHLQRWKDAIAQRPAVQRGIAQPPSAIDLAKDRDAAAERFAQEARRMVETGQSNTSKDAP